MVDQNLWGSRRAQFVNTLGTSWFWLARWKVILSTRQTLQCLFRCATTTLLYTTQYFGTQLSTFEYYQRFYKATEWRRALIWPITVRTCDIISSLRPCPHEIDSKNGAVALFFPNIGLWLAYLFSFRIDFSSNSDRNRGEANYRDEIAHFCNLLVFRSCAK